MRAAVALVLTVSVAALAGPAASPVVPTPRVLPNAALLTEIREVRHLRVAGDAAEDEMMFPSDRPGLRLTLDLRLPEGRRIIDIEQPERLEAADSTGHPLTDIPAGFGGEPEFIELSQSFDFDKEEYEPIVHLHLSSPRRSAETFSVTTAVQVMSSTGVKDVSLDIKPAWADLDPADFGGQAVRVRLKQAFGEEWGVELSPSRAALYIEGIEVGVEGNAISSSGSMSDDRTIVYFLDDAIDPQEPVTLRLKLRTGVETTAVAIEIKDQRLP